MNSYALINNRKNMMARKIVDNSRVRVLPSDQQNSIVPAPNKLNCGGADCFYVQSLIQNRLNFKRSGVPARLLYHEDGSWVDFSEDVIGSIRSAFEERKPVVEVRIGSLSYLFDFYRMLLIDFEIGNERSVAWIDIHNQCFFPKSVVSGGGCDEVGVHSNSQKFEIVNYEGSGSCKIEIEVRVGGDLIKRKREDFECEFGEQVKEEECEGSSSSNQQQDFKKQRKLVVSELDSPRWPKSKLLKEGEKGYSVVKKLLMSWVGIAESGATVTAIHQCTRATPVERARYEVFQKQLEIKKAARGDPNVSFAWLRCSPDGLEKILRHGFCNPSKAPVGEGYGVGIYLSPVKATRVSAMLSDEDCNGEHHVVLCRVILGNCEKIEAGSQQLYPSNVDFDTGVDDVSNPNWYIVWGENMNTHILPECVVSYKPTHRVAGQSSGTSYLTWVPNSTNTLTSKFFSKLTGVLPSSKVPELQTLCSTYKSVVREKLKEKKSEGTIEDFRKKRHTELTVNVEREIREKKKRHGQEVPYILAYAKGRNVRAWEKGDGKMPKGIFMKTLRSIVGDQVLSSAIREVRG